LLFKTGNTKAEPVAKSGIADRVKIILELSKIRITFLIALTTLLGYILAIDSFESFSLYPVFGIFLLACGAAALNHYQERRTDAMMARTMNRPLPSGKISASNSLMISVFFLLLGSFILLTKSNLMTLGIGLYTFFWYNAVYTPLKRMTAFAIIPGSLVGALPPIAGWAAGGGDVLNHGILLIAAYFFIWQIPHFWLLLMIYGKDYDKGGFPNLTNIFSISRLKMITFSWIILTGVTAVSINFNGLLIYPVSAFILLAVCLWLIFESVKFMKSENTSVNFKNMFIRINIFTLLIITILSVDKLINLFFSY